MSIKQKITLIFFLILGVVIQITPTVRSGINYPDGIGFWGPSGHDSVWHLSLINAITNPFDINLPIFAGEKLANYHPFFDILISFLSKVTFIPSDIWLFQLSPLVLSISLLLLSYYFGKLITKSHSGGILLLLLNSLSNSLGWIISYLRSGNFNGESIFWSMQSPSNQINPPYTLSLIFILILLIAIYQKKNYFSLFFITLILLPITKAYSAIVGFSIYTIYSLRSFFTDRQSKHLITLLLSVLCAIILFSIYNPQSSGLFVFKPFWFINSMIDSPDKLYLPKVSSLRYTLESSKDYDIRLPLTYIASFVIFIIGNFGFRLFGFIKANNLPRYLHVALFSNIVILTLIPTLFIQKGTSWNTIQFLYYALFLSNIYLAIYLQSILKHTWGKVLAGIIFITYVLSFFGSLPNYFGGSAPAFLPAEEVRALSFLKTIPSGIVLTVPYDKYIKDNFKTTPIPLYAYETTAYVSAYSHQLVYLEDEMNLNNSGYDFMSRRQNSLDFFSQKNIYQDRGFLINNQISYIYLTGLQSDRFKLDTQKLSLDKIFELGKTIIYQVQR